MANYYGLKQRAMRRDGMRCCACGNSDRPVLATHHVIPVELRGQDRLSNLITLCANCHRTVHWLSTGDRSVDGHAYGLGRSTTQRRRLLALARRIRRHRLRVVGPDLVLTKAVPFETAMRAIIHRNGFKTEEATLLRRCFKRALRAMAASDRKACSVRLVRGGQFISVNVNNHLVLRAPAFSDRKQRIEGDMILIWPKAIRPRFVSDSRFRSAWRFDRIPHVSLSLTWEECLALSQRDWKVFQRACHNALTLVRTRRWTSNVIF